MTTTLPSTATTLRLAALGIASLASGLAGCFLLLPQYQKVEARILLAEAITASGEGQNNRAIAELNQAVELDSKNAQAYFYRGQAYGRMEDYDHAIADFSHALLLDPQDEQILFNCGYSYEGKGDFKDALATYTRAVTSHPKSALAYNDVAWLLATCPLAEFRDGQKAVQYATKACELSEWKDPVTLDTLASADAEVGEFDTAVKWESIALNTPGFGENDIAGAKLRLALYQNHQPYHRDNDQ
jgi:tetratricopeptide (TPR) repeat protein